MNLDMCKDRLDRLKTNAGEPVNDESPKYASKIANEAMSSIPESPTSSIERKGK